MIKAKKRTNACFDRTMLETRNTWDWLMKQTDSLGEWSSSLLKGPHEHAWGAHDLLLLRSLAPGTGRDAHTVRVLAACIFPRLLEPAAGLTSEKTLEAELRERRHASHLKSDVIELAATADRRSARMDHAVHRNDARAALRGSPGPFPGGAPRRGAAGCGFAFYSLLARHFTRFLNELRRTLRVICAKKKIRREKFSFAPQMSPEISLLFASGWRANRLLLWLLLYHFLLFPGAQTDQCALERRGAKLHLERKAVRAQRWNKSNRNLTEIVFIIFLSCFALKAPITTSDLFLQHPYII